MEEKTTPKNRNEQEIAGYRDVLGVIHESFDAILITQNYILQLHKILYSNMNNPVAGCSRRSSFTETAFMSAYRDFEDRFALVETKRSALDTVRLAARNKIGRFSKQDIRELCPSLSVSSIEGALRKLVQSGELIRDGKGKNTVYRRVK